MKTKPPGVFFIFRYDQTSRNVQSISCISANSKHFDRSILHKKARTPFLLCPQGSIIESVVCKIGKGEVSTMESKQRLLEPQLVQTGRADQFSRKVFCDGMRDGVPIALGYFAVSFSLGIAARKAGFTPFQGFLVSLLNNASAGEYAAFALIMANATYFEVAVITLIANARYLLMSCALAQRFVPETPFWHRLLIGYDVTDELFGITIARPGSLNPYYTYGAILLAAPAWASGTALGIIAGNLLPLRVVSALSVALYGMFLAIIIPPARKDRIVAVLVVISFALSFLCSYLPGISVLSEGTRTILLTVAISGAAAVLFPVRQEENENDA